MKKFILKYLSPTQIEDTLGAIALIFIAIVAYFLISLSLDLRSIKSDFASTTSSFQQKIAELEFNLNVEQKTTADLSERVAAQTDRSDSINSALQGVVTSVGTLEKLSKTDRELLQKYSKVYFLNENYIPSRLAQIDSKYLQPKDKPQQFHAVVLPYLTKMLDSAEKSNVDISIVSAYRSFGTQAALKSSYLITYGSGANKFSSDQGFSEHQLGTTVDVIDSNSTTGLSTNFENTPAYNWLVDNAYRFGFVLSYPRNNTYYQYEPWHWRFVGVELATYLHNMHKYFYDIDQRQIDAYLANIFDQE